MFAYCLNNPANGCDPCGTCFHRWDFWNDCEKCGGKTIGDKINNVTTWCVDAYNRVNTHHQEQISMQAQVVSMQNELIADAANSVCEAYGQSLKLQRETQIKEAQSMLDATMQISHYLDAHDDVVQGLTGSGKAIKGAVGIGSGVALLLAPIPTPADDLVAIRKITFGVYNVCYGIAEIVGSFVG